MSETETHTVDGPVPRITAVTAHEGFTVTLTWDRQGERVETVDLAPAILRYRIYAPLRDNPGLFRSVHVADDGFAIAWGDDEIDMASTTIEELASEVMRPADFDAFIKRHTYTLDSVAAELGISRRQVAYYRTGKPIPRYIALACAFLDTKREQRPAAQAVHHAFEPKTLVDPLGIALTTAAE